jgi:hypothetical protein
MIFSFASGVSYVPIDCRYPFMRYWQPLLAKTTAQCFQRHPENECQWGVNSCRTWRLCNQGIVQIFACITVLLTVLLSKNTISGRWNTDTKLLDIANCSTKQKHIVGCWKRDFDKILLTHCKFSSLIWIYRWTRWHSVQFRWVRSLPWNRTRVASSSLWTTSTTNLAMVQFGPGPQPDVTVRNRC